MSSDFFAVQEALFNALSADAPLQALLGSPMRLYDHVPPDAVFPFVTLGEMQAEPFDTFDHDGMAQLVTLHVWSRQRGRKESKAIMDALYQRLHHGALTISGRQLVLCRFLEAEALLEDDGLTYHGVARYQVLTRGVSWRAKEECGEGAWKRRPALLMNYWRRKCCAAAIFSRCWRN